MTAIQYALNVADTGGSLFVFTDAAAKDVGLAGDVAALAVAKKIKVFPAIFPSDCSSTDGFDFIASQSSGQILTSGDRSEAGDVTILSDSVVRSNDVDVLSAEGRRCSEVAKMGIWPLILGSSRLGNEPDYLLSK